jgi:hypothetical protein
VLFNEGLEPTTVLVPVATVVDLSHRYNASPVGGLGSYSINRCAADTAGVRNAASDWHGSGACAGQGVVRGHAHRSRRLP